MSRGSSGPFGKSNGGPVIAKARYCMKWSWVVIGIVALVALWLFSRMAGQAEPQVVPEFIGAPQAESQGEYVGNITDAQTRLGVFQTIASLAQSANDAILQKLGIQAQL